ncbi:n-ethylammeline chlorohydrolase [Pseudomassariella vexata]|uniref:N-ethylammeline chlorohydrolase n=1 Tax=Pseudomassariella vexata TaxID=1141098 RepID=A0A1Y2EII6_9PEZI|nr:n-ethylammeline chlorohydrolase [Pseudomassariella vexata]ORY71388.1 n-ethylammeline chlorohydrolase [Pseudomassariella vexata]
MPRRIVVTNATILTLDDKDSLLFPGTLEIRDDKIHSIRSSAEDSDLAKGYGDDAPLWEYLDEVWYPAIRALTPQRARVAALYSYATALKSGTTTVNDMYRQLNSLASAAEQVGIRAVLSNDVALAEHKLDSAEDNVAAFKANDGAADGRVKVWMGLEWLPLADESLLRDVENAMKDLNTGLHIHLCESRTEVKNSLDRFGGKRPVEVAHEAGLLGPRTVAAHCVHLSETEVELLAKTGTSVSINSGSNAKLGNGIARVQDLVKAGVNVGIGVDACECHNSVDMFEEMKITSYMQRALHEDPVLGQPGPILRMATLNGAKALGLDAGTIEVGKKADIILIDLRKDMMFTPLLKGPLEGRRKQLDSHLVFGCNGTGVDTVIVDGRIVVRDRKVLGINEEVVRKEMDEMFAAVVDEMQRKQETE